MLHTLLAQLLLAATYVFASPVDLLSRTPQNRPGDLNHRPSTGSSGKFKTKPDIPSLRETITANGDMTSQLELAFKPYLEVVDSCSPVAAVDPEGYTSEGLASKSSDNKDCFKTNQESEGQMYARRIDSELRGKFSNLDGIMYCWYFPKSTGGKKSHKHEWQIAIVWLNVEGTGDQLTNYKVAKVSVSTPGGYVTNMADIRPDHQVIQYQHSGLLLKGTDTPEGKSLPVLRDTNNSFYSPLVSWEAFTSSAKQALNDKQVLGGYSAPFSDGPARDSPMSQFQDHLNAAASR